MINKKDFKEIFNYSKSDFNKIYTTMSVISNNMEEYIIDNKIASVEEVDEIARDLMAEYLHEEDIYYNDSLEKGNIAIFEELFEKEYGDAFLDLVRMEAQMIALISKISNSEYKQINFAV